MRARRRPFRTVRCASAALLLALLVGCSPAPPPSPPARAEPPAASVEVVQRRTDLADRILVLSVTNTGALPLAIVRAELDSPSLAEPAVVDDHEVVIAPGRTIDLRTPVPPADCAAAVGAGTVRLELADGGAATVEPTDPTGTIGRLTAEACTVEAVAAIVAIEPPMAVPVTGSGAASVARLELALHPTGAPGSVRITGVHSTNLLASAQTGTSWVLDTAIAGTDAPGVLALEAVPTRCDAHAAAEDKVGTILVLDVELDDGRAGRYPVALPDPAKAAVFGFLARACSR